MPVLILAVLAIAAIVFATRRSADAPQFDPGPFPDPGGGIPPDQPPDAGTPPDSISTDPFGTPESVPPPDSLDWGRPANQPMPGDRTSVWLPGNNHDFDNQFVYAASLYTGRAWGDEWTGGLFLKTLTWKEQGRSWSWNPSAINNNPPREVSVGLMQVNTLAHTEFSVSYLRDPNDNILAGATIAGGAWEQAVSEGAPDLPGRAATVYNAGSGSRGVSAYGRDVSGRYNVDVASLPVA